MDKTLMEVWPIYRVKVYVQFLLKAGLVVSCNMDLVEKGFQRAKLVSKILILKETFNKTNQINPPFEVKK